MYRAEQVWYIAPPWTSSQEKWQTYVVEPREVAPANLAELLIPSLIATKGH